MRELRSCAVLDFGTLLPFNFAAVRTPDCWCGFLLQLNEDHCVEREGELQNYPERWAYFLWLPLLHRKMLGQPDVCEIVDEIPYQQIFTTVWNSPVHMLNECDVDLVVLGRNLLEFGDCEDWVRTEVVKIIVRADGDPKWRRVWERMQATPSIREDSSDSVADY